ncbi:MAG: arylsulfatase A-like enzyme, partial [Planctomycetota bacterium]
GTPLRAGEETIASLLKAEGYATGGYGKWGCGGRDSTGVPEEHGFDEFFGYYDQVHAHSFYPPYLVRNSEEVPLDGNVGGRIGESYSHYAIMESGLDFIRANKDKPFFCYLPITPPHGMYDIPSDDPAWELYKDEAWVQRDEVSQDVKNYAAMVSMVDYNVGQVLDLLKELELDEDTIVFFSGDNGGQDRFKSKAHPRGFFGPNVHPQTGVEFRGGKGNLYEGGLRIPFMVRWPGRIEAGRESDLVFYQPDVLPTLSALCDADTPDDVDGMSILPTLLGDEEQAAHEFLYWEFGSQLAVRMGDWKGILKRTSRGEWSQVLKEGKGKWSLFDVTRDVSEATDVATEHPKVIAELAAIAAREFTPARPGTYTDVNRTRHEKDRQAKWGTSKGQPKPTPRGKLHQILDKDLVPFAEMKIVSFSSENQSNGKLARHAIDGDSNTIWHSRFSHDKAEHPHELVIDLGATYSVRGMRYLARQDGGWNGAFGSTEFTLSDSATGFSKEPQLRASFGKHRTAQAADFKTARVGRYLRVRILSEANDGIWASAAELGVVGVRQ